MLAVKIAAITPLWPSNTRLTFIVVAPRLHDGEVMNLESSALVQGGNPWPGTKSLS
ncbi:hypothetical protein [Cribrihabitans neustonicus]|uniref:hypothetical protein n=1 Tax=Cribrihabitans neustonicus TaxID=1429085 RepID=UPI003B593FCF